MNYLGHFEFGINHKSWNNPNNYRDFNDINYWLEQWLLYYKKIYSNFTKLDNLYLVSYESICKDKDSEYLKHISLLPIYYSNVFSK